MFFNLIFSVLAFLGFLDSLYLTINHYKHVIPPCTIAHGCETVLTSQFSTLNGLPLGIFGMIFYAGLLISFLVYFQTKRRGALLIVQLGVTIGLLVSVFLFLLQAFVIHAFCQYCMLSELLVVGLFFSTLLELLKLKNKHLNY